MHETDMYVWYKEELTTGVAHQGALLWDLITSKQGGVKIYTLLLCAFLWACLESNHDMYLISNIAMKNKSLKCTMLKMTD